MTISIIVARAENGAIGKGNDLIWHLPEDLKFFKRTTMGGALIMGHRTFDSVGRPLPGRLNIVLSRSSDLKIDGCVCVQTMDEAIKVAQEHGHQEVFVAGGAQIYALALPVADKLYITEVKDSFEADTFFPEFPVEEWKEVSREDHSKDAKHLYEYSFVLLEKKRDNMDDPS